MYDYKEEIAMTEELAGLLGVVGPEVEKRQCVTKVLAAGFLMHQTKPNVLPTLEEVESQAQVFRLEQARMATEAEGVMGHADVKVSPIEHELRMYSHDILNRPSRLLQMYQHTTCGLFSRIAQNTLWPQQQYT